MYGYPLDDRDFPPLSAAPSVPNSRDLQHDRVDDPTDGDGEYYLDPRQLHGDFSAFSCNSDG